MRATSARLLGPKDGKAGFLGSIGVRFMVDGSDSGGGFSLVEHPMYAHALAAPLHRHTREDEYSYVIEGRVGALLGDDVVFGAPGDLIFKPRNQWHTFWNAGDRPRDSSKLLPRPALNSSSPSSSMSEHHQCRPCSTRRPLGSVQPRDGSSKHPRPSAALQSEIPRRAALTSTISALVVPLASVIGNLEPPARKFSKPSVSGCRIVVSDRSSSSGLFPRSFAMRRAC